MATQSSKPAPSTGAVPALKKTVNTVSVQDTLAAQVAALAGKIAPVNGNMIRVTLDKKFQLPNGAISAGPLHLVVLDFLSVNRFYEDEYDKDNVVPPACFAIDASPLNMVPSANCPAKQCDSCNDCPMNQFNSAGKAKACKNTRLLAVLPPGAEPDTPICLLSVSPTALKAWDSYVGSVVRTFGQPPIAVVTEVSFSDDSDFPTLRFGNPEPNEAVAGYLERLAEAVELLKAEPDVWQYQPPAPLPARAHARPHARKSLAAHR